MEDSIPKNFLCGMNQKALKTPNPKCRLFLKIDLSRDLAACIYKSEAHSPPRFLFGVVKQFCRFKIWSNTQCITHVDVLHTTRSPPPLLHIVQYRLYRPVLIHTGKGGGVNWREGRGALVHKRVENANMTDCISSL
jgi:hypothetical protein